MFEFWQSCRQLVRSGHMLGRKLCLFDADSVAFPALCHFSGAQGPGSRAREAQASRLKAGMHLRQFLSSLAALP